MIDDEAREPRYFHPADAAAYLREHGLGWVTLRTLRYWRSELIGPAFLRPPKLGVIYLASDLADFLRDLPRHRVNTRPASARRFAR